MTLNEDHIRELLDAAEPAPWSVARIDLHRDTGVVDNEHAVASKHLAARAPELAADWLRLKALETRLIEWRDGWADYRDDLNRCGINSKISPATIVNAIDNNFLNGDTNE